jgi:hypothetical protein
MRNFLFVLAVLVGGQAWGANAPDNPVHYFDSVNDAAAAAFMVTYRDHPHYYEYGGVIIQTPNGKFVASEPDSLYHADNTDIDTDIETYEIPGKIVADYHTHPCVEGYHTGEFSPDDLHGARSTGLPGYMLDECTGDIHLWSPGDGIEPAELKIKGDPKIIAALPPELIKRFTGPQLAIGKIVGHVEVDGKKIKL